MKNLRTSGNIGAGIAAALLGLLAVGVAATPALAGPLEPDSYSITTSSTQWQNVYEPYGTIGDAEPYNSGTGIWGWTNDAFDGMPYSFVIAEGEESSWSFVADDAERTINEGGESSIVLTGHTEDTFDTDYAVTLTITLEGSYARWAYVITGGDSSGVDVFFEADLGSDNGSTYIESGNTLVSNDSGNGDGGGGYDPVLGFSVATDGEFTGYNVADGDSGLRPGARNATTFTLTSVIADYEPTAEDEATAFVASLVPTLDATFGEAYTAVRGGFFMLDPITLTQGVAVDAILSGTLSQEVIDNDYLGDEAGEIGAIFQNVPAGLTLGFSQDENLLPVIEVTGTPTESGDFGADITLYQVGSRVDDLSVAPDESIGENPISATAAVTVIVSEAPAASGSPAVVKPALAATGLDGMVIVGFGGLVVAAGTLLVVATRCRKA